MPSVMPWMGVVGKKMNAISLILGSPSLPFPFPECDIFLISPTFLLSVNFLSAPHSPRLLYRGHCATCECYWFGRLAGVWPGVTHLLPGGLLSVPSQLTLRCVYVCFESVHRMDFSDRLILSVHRVRTVTSPIFNCWLLVLMISLILNKLFLV